MQKVILFYINQIYDGGAERVMVNLANHFAESGYQSILLTSFREKGEYMLSPKVNRISVEEEERKDGKFKKNFRRTAYLRNTIKRYRPSIVVSFMTEPIVRMFAATAGMSVKRMISVRSDPKTDYKSRLRWLIGKLVLPMAQACVFQTAEARDWFPRRMQKRSRIICNPTGDSFYHINRNPVRGKIVTCGRLVAIKNHKMLIEAFYEVQKRFHETSLEIYGEGELKLELQAFIDSLGMSDKVFLKGQTSNVEEVLSQAELFVLSSDVEGMPNALQEALAAGVPCISTDCPCGGPAMLIDDGYNGMLCKPGDTIGLKDSILRLLEDRQKREAMGEEAKKRAKMFSSDEIYRQWEEYVAEVISE